MTTFRIQRAIPGKYHNSPPIAWRDCGLVRAETRDEAAVKACTIVGRSLGVRVMMTQQSTDGLMGDSLP